MVRAFRKLSLTVTVITMITLVLAPAFSATCVAANGASCVGDCCRAGATYCRVFTCPKL